MGYGSGGRMNELGGRMQLDPALLQGLGKGDTLAKDAIMKNPEKFFEYFGQNANIGATKENFTEAQLKERDKMGMLGKAIWDFTNQRYAEHKNNIQQIRWNVKDVGRFVTKGAASLGDINSFMSSNDREFSKLLGQLSKPDARSANAAERKLTQTLSEFLGRVSIPTTGQLFASSYNGLRDIRNQHKELKTYIKEGRWDKVAKFKVDKNTRWAQSYVKSAQTIVKNSKVVGGKIEPRKGRSAAVAKRLETLNKWKNSGNKNPRALSLGRISSNMARLTAQMSQTSARARSNGVPISKRTTDGVATYNAQLTQGVKNMVNNWRKSTGLTKLTNESVMSALRKETQGIRKRKA